MANCFPTEFLSQFNEKQVGFSTYVSRTTRYENRKKKKMKLELHLTDIHKLTQNGPSGQFSSVAQSCLTFCVKDLRLKCYLICAVLSHSVVYDSL